MRPDPSARAGAARCLLRRDRRRAAGGRATFNVAIRTVSAQGSRPRCGIGSGITSGATVLGEWREWCNKRVFLDRASEPFDLLETLALQAGVLRNLDLHLARLRRAASHFGYPFDESALRAGLAELARAHAEGLWRVRVLLDAGGRHQVQAFAMEASPSQVTLLLAERPFEAAHSEFVRYKTTRRAHYDAAAPAQPGVFDAILWNEQGELTECTRGNLALQIDGQWLTPALSSGLLDGVGRRSRCARAGSGKRCCASMTCSARPDLQQPAWLDSGQAGLITSSAWRPCRAARPAGSGR